VGETERIFGLREVTRLLGLNPKRAAQLRRLGVLSAGGGYTFRDLVAIRMAGALLDSGATVRQIRQALNALRRQAPGTSPLSEMRLVVEGQRVLAQTDQVRFDPRTGQMVLALDVGGLEKEAAATLTMGRVRPLAPPAAQAEMWFERASQWDADPAHWEDAIEAYEKVVAIDPGYAAAWNNLGLLRHRMGQYAEGQEAYEAALRAEPQCAEAAYNLGSLFEDLGELPASIRYYQMALALSPDYADAHFNLAGVLGRSARNREAGDHWRRYLQLDSESPWASVARSHLELEDE
jgi:cytochrome c-type biogenesis protein CcmH/NrfG